MSRKILYFFFICCVGLICSNLRAQQLSNREVLPFLIKAFPASDQPFTPDSLNIILNQAYAVKGPLPTGIHVTRKLSDSINIVFFHSPEEIKKWQGKVQVLGEVNDGWKLSSAFFKELSMSVPEEKNTGLILSVQDVTSFKKQYEPGKQIIIRAAYGEIGRAHV